MRRATRSAFKVGRSMSPPTIPWPMKVSEAAYTGAAEARVTRSRTLRATMDRPRESAR